MATTSTQRAQTLKLLGARSMMRLKDFAAHGIGPETLARLVREGIVVRPARGLYQLAEPRGISFELLAEEGFHAGALVQSVGAGQWVLRAMARAVAVLAWPASVRRLERH